MFSLFTRLMTARHAAAAFLSVALFSIAVLTTTTPAFADFPVAREITVEARPAVALNSQTGEFFVAYLETQTAIPGNPVELRVRRFNSDGVQQGGVLQPLGSGSHEALGRPAIAYSEGQNLILVAVPVKKDGFSDRVLARFLAPDGSSVVGPDFMFDDGLGFYDDGQSTDGNGSLQITHNSLLDEFVITVQRTVAGNNGVWAQKLESPLTPGSIIELNNHGINGQKSHDIEFAAVSTTTPFGGRYLFINNGSFGTIKVLDANLATVTAVPSINWGEPALGNNHHNISFGRVEGKDRWLIVWADDNNCRPGFVPCPDPLFQWSGIWGTYIDPLNPLTGNNTPFPISKIPTHVVTETLHKPRVSYNRDAESFYVAWREVPVLDPLNDESLSHIRGNRIDYFVADGLPGALVPLPYDNVVLSTQSGSCTPSLPCFSTEDPVFPDVAANDGFGAAVVWEETYQFNPDDQDIWGDFLNPPVPANDSITTPLVLSPADPPEVHTLVGSSSDGSANCGSSTDEPDVWFVVESPVNGTLVLDTCGSNDLYGPDTGMDTVLSLHQPDGTQLGGASCSDDWPSSLPGACAGDDSGALRDSAVEFPVVANQPILVRLSRYGGSFGGRYILNYGFEPDVDSDGDGISDLIDNCLMEPNPAQRDTDGDNIGNFCDPDIGVPNDCIVNFIDYSTLTNAFLAMPGSANWNPDADFNGDSAINFVDVFILTSRFLQAPGPSGLPNACTP